MFNSSLHDREMWSDSYGVSGYMDNFGTMRSESLPIKCQNSRWFVSGSTEINAGIDINGTYSIDIWFINGDIVSANVDIVDGVFRVGGNVHRVDL